MTAPTEPTSTDDTDAGSEPDAPTADTADATPTANGEAARYRVQLREAEAARDALAERLTAYQRRECEAAVADILDVPSDLWEVAQADITAMYNEDGTPNTAELRAAATALIDQRPRLGKPPAKPRGWGQRGDVAPGSSGASWGSVIKPD